MKKFLVTSTLFMLIFLLLPKDVSAQCDPSTGRNCFSCEWTGIECDVDWTYTAYPPYGCVPGFEVDPTKCQGLDYSDCQGAANLDCVETSSGVCYECVDTLTGCIPRDPDDPRCEYSDADSCWSACTGSEPTRFRCESGDCIEDGSGPYEGLGACAAACGGGGIPEVKVPIFCVGDDPSDTTTDNTGKLATAVGCIPIGGGQEFISFILRWAIGIAGGIAFLLILFAGFQIVTSSGDPKRLQAGRELLTAAIAGLMLLILSVFILRLIGYDLLGLPGFAQ